ncbi:MAG: hypothetical protein QOF03_1335 [Alphaproteobacteria bacterium]|nr:hypothetical protein [Alphaproteobacteria bacterium]
MNIFEFITQDEIDELPEDPNWAFVNFVRHAQRRLTEYSQAISSNDEEGWRAIQDAQYSFKNVVVAAAKQYGIEPFMSTSVPHLNRVGADDYRQFIADLDHYMTQLVLDHSIRGKRESVFIATPVKDKIRVYVYELKKCIDAADITDAKRAALLDKLADFERELDKRRLSLWAVMTITFTILSVPGGVWSSVDIVSKLTSNILQTVGEAKATDDETRQLIPTQEPKALMPPRKPEEEVVDKKRSFQRGDLDDEIPF